MLLAEVGSSIGSIQYLLICMQASRASSERGGLVVGSLADR